MFGYVIGILLYVSLKLSCCIITGNALINAKLFLESCFVLKQIFLIDETSEINKTDGFYPI